MGTPGQAVFGQRSVPRSTSHTRSAFFVWSAAALAVVIFAGFAPTFYLRPWLNAPPLPSTLVLVHGVAFSLWPALLVLQTVLVASGRTPLHRSLGIAGAILATTMLVLGAVVTMQQIERSLAGGLPPGFPPIGFVFSLSEISIFAFAGLVAAAVYHRRRPDTHKRLMLAATALISPAGIARLLPFAGVGLAPGALSTFVTGMLIADLFLVALALHDLARLGKLHPATLWGAVVTVASQASPIALGQSAAFNATVTSWFG